MTESEFQDKYHNYSTKELAEAEKEAEKVRAQGVDVVAIQFQEKGAYCLMLRRAAELIGLSKESRQLIEVKNETRMLYTHLRVKLAIVLQREHPQMRISEIMGKIQEASKGIEELLK